MITKIAEIASLNRQLGARLSGRFKYKERREITYPSNHHTGTVYFEHRSGQAVRGWCPGRDDNKLLNYLVTGEPGSTAWIKIDVQLNFPSAVYNRSMAGAFVRDGENRVFLAHRGKLTRGKAGLRKEKVFREFAPLVIEADDDPRPSRLILIGALDDSDLPERLWAFAEEARAVANKLGAELHGNGDTDEDENDAGSSTSNTSKATGTAAASAGQQMALSGLRDYFAEFSGESKFKGYESGTRVVTHGAVVRDLEGRMAQRGVTQKSQAIDLAVITDKIHLFEVKTSADTTDIYTGTGQLLIHGGSLADRLRLPVERYLVLPAKPKTEHEKQLRRIGRTRVITYAKVNGRYEFSDL